MNTSYPIAVLLLASLTTAQVGRYRDEVFSQVSVQSDIAYGQAVNSSTRQQETLLLDLYEPIGDRAQRRPVIVLAHGGGFIVGSKSDPDYVQIAEAFARRGYVAASIDYRLARPPLQQNLPQTIIDASHDLKAAVRWLRAHAGQQRIDVDRIVGFGGSAGGILSLQAAYDDALGEGSSGNPGVSSEIQAVISLWGSLPDVNDIEAGEQPLQIIHGTNDPIVSYQNALDLKARADAVGVHAELVPIQGGSHAAYADYLQTYQVESFAFLYRELRLAELAGLAARPGFASPGTLTLDSYGLAGDAYAILAGSQPSSVPIPGLGTLCIGPSPGLLLAVEGVLPATPRLAAEAWSVAVPAGLAGATIHWQALHLEGPEARWLTNCVATQF